MTDDATYRAMKQQRDAALAECERLRADAERHRDGRLAALEKAATLESSLIEIGDLAASCRTGPALYESLQHIEQMAIFAIDEARAKP